MFATFYDVASQVWEDNGSYSYKCAKVTKLIVNSSSFLNVNVPKDISYLTVHQVYDQENNTNVRMKNITAEIEGRKVKPIEQTPWNQSLFILGVTREYSNNPAEILIDIMQDALSISTNEIDLGSFWQSKEVCNDNNWTCNIAFMRKANIQSVITDVLATCRGQLIHSNDQWKMIVDTRSKTTSIVGTLTDDDFVGTSLNMAMKGNNEIANQIKCTYINPEDEWLSAEVSFADAELETLDGQLIEKTLDIKGVTNSDQASTMAQITLNSMRYSEDASGNRIKQTPLSLSFATTIKNANLEVGDVIKVQSDLLNFDRHFVILSCENDQSGLIQISTREYCETHYKNSAGNYLIDGITPEIPEASTTYSYEASSPANPNTNIVQLQDRDDLASSNNYAWEYSTGKLYTFATTGSGVSLTGNKYYLYFLGGYISTGDGYGTEISAGSEPTSLGNKYDDSNQATSAIEIITKD